MLFVTESLRAENNSFVSSVSDAISKADFIKCEVGTVDGDFFRPKGDFYLSPLVKNVSTPNTILVDPITKTFARYNLEGKTLKVDYYSTNHEGNEVPIGTSKLEKVFNIKKNQDEYRKQMSTPYVKSDKGWILKTQCYSAPVKEILEKANNCAEEDYGYRKRMLKAQPYKMESASKPAAAN